MLSIFLFYGGGALLILRVVLGIVLIAHGWPKLKDMKKTAAGFDQMGFKPGRLFGTLAMILEFFGGIAIILGFLVQIVAAFLIIQFVVIIIWKISKKMPLVGGWELDFLILGIAILLFALGGGAHALDTLLFY